MNLRNEILVGLIAGATLLGLSPFAYAESFNSPSGAHSSPRLSNSTTLTTSATETSGVMGDIDLRPSWQPDSNRLSSYNYAEIGYQFSPNFTLAYQQYFYTFFANGPATSNSLQAFDGVVRGMLRHLYDSPDRSLTLGDDIELVLPIDPIKKNAGMVGALRNVFILEQNLTPSTKLTLKDAPMIYGYQQRGGMLPTSDGSQLALGANPIFENLASAGLSYTFGRTGWSLNVPIYLDSTRYYDFDPTAANNNSWQQVIFVYPELDYAANANLTLGLGYQSDNLLNFTNANGDDNDVGTGTFRFIVKASF